MEARPAARCARCSSRASPTATSPSSCTKTSRSPSRSTSPRSPRSLTDSSTTSVCARATVSRSRCATSPSGRSRSGPRLLPARSSCRSTRGGRGPSSSTGSSDSGSVIAFVDEERHERLTDHYASLPNLRGIIVAKAERRCRTARAAIRGRAGRSRPGRPAARGRARSRGRRDDLLHIGHHRVPQGRARHPSQHLHEPDEPRVRISAIGGPLRRAGARRSRWWRAERVSAVSAVLPRHRLPLGARGEPRLRREDRDHVPLGRRSRARADRARAHHDLRRCARDGVAGARSSRLRHARHLEREVDRVRRRARGARARAAHRGDVPRPHAEQRLRPDRDLVGDDDELGRGLRAQARERRRARRGVRREGRRRRRRSASRPARSASSGSRGRTS